MPSCVFKLSVAAAAFALHTASHAVPLYLNFSGNNASGYLNDVDFEGAAWSFEYVVETEVGDDDSAIESGLFLGAITGGQMSLNGTVYQLAGSSATGLVNLLSYADGYDAVVINPTSGGYLQFLTGRGTTFPALFGDVNSLQSARLGVTVRDSTTDVWNNASYVSYQQQASGPGVSLVDGAWMNIFAFSGAASGDFSVTVANHSQMPIVSAVPEPGMAWLTALGLTGLLGWRQRARQG